MFREFLHIRLNMKVYIVTEDAKEINMVNGEIIASPVIGYHFTPESTEDCSHIKKFIDSVLSKKDSGP